MNDIVEQLRYYAKATYCPRDVYSEAADEIEWLRVENKFLRDELACSESIGRRRISE